MLKDASKAGGSLGEELRVAVEKEKGDGEEERAVVAEGFGKVPMEEGVSCALESTPWAAIARGGADDAAREGVGRWIKESIQPHSYPEEQKRDEQISALLEGGAMGLCRGEGSVIHPREKGGYPSGGLADDLQELGVVLVASQILNVEPVDDRQDATAPTREELEHAVACVAEHEAVDAE